MILQLKTYDLSLVNALCAAVFLNEQHRAADARQDLEKVLESVRRALGADEVNLFDFAGLRFVKVDMGGTILEIEVKPRPAPAAPKDVPDNDPDPGTPGAPEIPKLAVAA